LEKNLHSQPRAIQHIPTGEIATAQTRSRQNSLKLAIEDITNRINNKIKSELDTKISSNRKQQVGTGMRGDKIRTYRFQDDSVVDHRTQQRLSARYVLEGHFDQLWSSP
jgi:peptide chain release factor 1